MSKPSLLVCLTLALVVGLAPRPARADGAVIAKSALPEPVRASLKSSIAQARSTRPAAFGAVKQVVTSVQGSAKRTRNAKPSAARAFRRLGHAALYPLIELVAFDAERGSLNDDEWRALGDGALQALAFLRETKASPVLARVFEHAKDPLFVEHAAEGLGMLCGDSERALLLSHLDPASPLRSAAIMGLAYCHRSDVAEKLAPALDDSDPNVAARAARALGYVGSSWALAADADVTPDEREQIRAFSSHVLVAAYPAREKAVRDVIYRAIVMVAHSSARADIDAAKARASGDVKSELDRLSRRLDLNAKRSRD